MAAGGLRKGLSSRLRYKGGCRGRSLRLRTWSSRWHRDRADDHEMSAVASPYALAGCGCRSADGRGKVASVVTRSIRQRGGDSRCTHSGIGQSGSSFDCAGSFRFRQILCSRVSKEICLLQPGRGNRSSRQSFPLRTLGTSYWPGPFPAGHHGRADFTCNVGQFAKSGSGRDRAPLLNRAE